MLSEHEMIIGTLAAAYPRDHVAASTVSLMASRLSGISAFDLKCAADLLMREARAFPTEADIRQIVMGTHRQERRPVALPESRGAPMPDHIKKQIEKIGMMPTSAQKNGGATYDETHAKALERARREFPHVRAEVEAMYQERYLKSEDKAK